MLYIIAFVIGGCARSVPKAAMLAGLYVCLYAALLVAISAGELRTGATSIPDVLRHLTLDASIAVAALGFGYLGRVVIGRRLVDAAATDDETTRIFD